MDHLTRICAVLASIALVASLGLHTIDISHVHPGHGTHDRTHDHGLGATISEYAHATEKKVFVLAGVFLLLFTAFLQAADARFSYAPRGYGAGVPRSLARFFGVREYAYCRSVFHSTEH